jgi:ATPase subunit of ABC transporter with duplicated ATPase domains
MQLGRNTGSSATTTVVVSHDAALIEGACDRIMEVRGGRLHTYTGGWQYFLRERAERERRIATVRASEFALLATRFVC